MCGQGSLGFLFPGLPDCLEIGEEVFLIAFGQIFQPCQAGGFPVGQVGRFPGVLCKVDQQVAGGLAAFPRSDLVEWPMEELPVSPADRPGGILVPAEVLGPEEVLVSTPLSLW